MKLFSNPNSQRLPLRWTRWLIFLTGIVGVGGVAYFVMGSAGVSPPAAVSPESPDPAGDGLTVRMAEARWSAAGIRVEPAAYSPFTERVWRSGRLALNDTRIAHISPRVEGVVLEVKARLGQDVRAGDVLAVLDSREVGQAKLGLVKARLASEYAEAEHGWALTTGQNASELLEAMASGAGVSDIENRFKGRPIGDLRQQLLTAYSRRLEARAHHEAVSQPGVQRALAEADVIRLRREFETAEAAYGALCEEVNFQTAQQARAAEQKLREARTDEALAEAALMMLGYTREEVESMDPIAEGPRVSLYPVRAPFAGTVIDQHAVPAERVGPDLQMFRIADLSTLWLQADVPHGDVPKARLLAGEKVRFRMIGEGGATYEADVFYTGDVVDESTRAVVLSAEVQNPERMLKPGMFVEVELTRHGPAAVHVPLEAVQHEGAQPFVFVHAGGEEFRRVDVKLGRTSDRATEVVSGVRPGEGIVVAGGFILKSELLKGQMAGD